jgi:RNA polymerase sigma factor (TIGR02999 family)
MTPSSHPEDAEITRLLAVVARGGDVAESDARLLELLEERLRRMARARMRGERPDHTLRPTELVNEAYLRIADRDGAWDNRAHFFGAAVEAMRRILVEHARRRAAEKRGGGVERVTFDDLEVASDEPDTDVLALDEALKALEAEDERLAGVVRLRYFGGYTIIEVAELLDVSPATVKRDWTYARAWLQNFIER